MGVLLDLDEPPDGRVTKLLLDGVYIPEVREHMVIIMRKMGVTFEEET
jgi:hypothetical protein